LDFRHADTPEVVYSILNVFSDPENIGQPLEFHCYLVYKQRYRFGGGHLERI